MASYQSLQIEMALQKMSESVYMGLCLKIGTSQQVAIRRELEDIREYIEHRQKNGQLKYMMSGSKREGFRLVDSDFDIMFWLDNDKVFWDFSQSACYKTNRNNLILSDSSESPPEFTLLWLPLERASRLLLSFCVKINGLLYISSAQCRNKICSALNQNQMFVNNRVHGPCSSGRYGGTMEYDCAFCFFSEFWPPSAYLWINRSQSWLLHYITMATSGESKVHGPCSSGRYGGTMEYDCAFCFFSEFWPPSAYLWINRSQSWPPPHVVDEIVRSGCHFVAIGHTLGKHADNEWRMSFSQAEQKLVHAMNHAQFLTYGLLKLFVKEINNGLPEKEKLLCSYHMKTAVFWVLQQNTTPHWRPLGCFWVCFKLLLKWVYEGVCPNFFIPENNMFLNKVHGVAQMNLFTKLYALYEKGIAFLLQSPSISPFIMKVLCNPRLTVCTDEHALIAEDKLETELFWEVFSNITIFPYLNIHTCAEVIHTVEQLLRSPLTQCQVIMLQKITATILQTSAFLIHDINTKTSGVNKHMYIADKMSCFMLKLAGKIEPVSDLLYIAMYFYKTFRYREALSVIEMAKVKLAQPDLMYKGHVDPERYTEAVGGQSWSYKMRRAVTNDIILDTGICYINELTLEQQSGLQQNCMLYIPPVVTLYMLEFLCCRHVDSVRAQAALDNLQVLVHHDQGMLVTVLLRDICWEILGICQQISGNFQAARDSYQQSLRQFPFNQIQTATIHRLHDLQ